jgi:Iap family predicted aminopeptidase
MQKVFFLVIPMLFLLSCKGPEKKQSQEVNKEFVLSERGGIPWMKKDILYLASDELEGRDTGTKGERLAAEYMIERMKGLGIKPAGTEGFLQPFEFSATPVISESNTLSIGATNIDLDEDAYPLNFCGSGAVSGKLIDCKYGIVASDLDYDDYAEIEDVKGNVALISVSSPDGVHPHSAYFAYSDLRTRAAQAFEKGALAVFFHKDDATVQDPSKVLTEKVDPLSGPVIFLKKSPADRNADVALDYSIVRERKTGNNVVGFLDLGKKNTVIIGAHYDHLGHGISGSLHAGESAIHNGADDNASGVAAMLQIAQDMKTAGTENNYLLIGFSGEERGLLGSNHFAKNPTINLSTVNYMINMDMVGRLNDEKNVVSINAVGTSPSWHFIDSLEVNGLGTVTTQSGVGPSDHTSFYLQDIPVLHFFSGTHTDYHKPSDDEHLINYEGMERIVAMIEHIIEEVDDEGKIQFTKTVQQEKTETSFKVTLGVMPDYTFEGKGFTFDGVSDGRPADKAGLIPGDIITKIASYPVDDIYSYMEALGKFEAGMTVKVQFLREGEEMTKNLTFD